MSQTKRTQHVCAGRHHVLQPDSGGEPAVQRALQAAGPLHTCPACLLCGESYPGQPNAAPNPKPLWRRVVECIAVLRSKTAQRLCISCSPPLDKSEIVAQGRNDMKIAQQPNSAAASVLVRLIISHE